MIGNLRPASDAEIDALLANPDHVTRFLYGGGSEERQRVDLGKTWHAIHFVLTGSRLGGIEPLNFLVDEGTPIGDVDVGFGPARALSSQQVRAIATQLTTPDEFAQRVNPRQLDAERIYPGGWQRNGSIKDIADKYRQLRELIVRTADSGLGLVLYIN
jgi:Domain of unknown function (DUF1877)